MLRRKLLVFLISILIGSSIYSWNAQTIVRNHLPMPFGYGTAVILSGSMEPTISKDDVILVQAQSDYALHDIVVYQSGDTLIVHRIVRMEDDKVWTKGDANTDEDAAIEKSAIKGKVIGILPEIGRIIKIIKTPFSMLFLLCLSFLSLWNSYRKQEKKGREEVEKLQEEIAAYKEQLQSNPESQPEEREEK
jgi:signal peptidase